MADLEENLLYVFSVFFIIVTEFLLIEYTQNIDTSSWNFTGSGIAISLLPYLPLFYLVVASGVIILALMKRRKT